MADVSSGSRIVAGGPRYAFLSVTVDRIALRDIETRIAGVPGSLRRIIPPALNKTAAEARTLFYTEFNRRLDLARKSSVRDRLALTPKASKESWVAGVRISLTRFALGSFRDVQQTPTGVTWSTGGPNASLRGGLLPRAFIRSGLTHYLTGKYQDTRQVWRRAQRGEKGFEKGIPTRSGQIVRRYPIKLLRGPSLAFVFSGDPSFQAEMDRRAQDILDKKILSQVDRVVAEVAK